MRFRKISSEFIKNWDKLLLIRIIQIKVTQTIPNLIYLYISLTQISTFLNEQKFYVFPSPLQNFEFLPRQSQNVKKIFCKSFLV